MISLIIEKSIATEKLIIRMTNTIFVCSSVVIALPIASIILPRKSCPLLQKEIQAYREKIGCSIRDTKSISEKRTYRSIMLCKLYRTNCTTYSTFLVLPCKTALTMAIRCCLRTLLCSDSDSHRYLRKEFWCKG